MCINADGDDPILGVAWEDLTDVDLQTVIAIFDNFGDKVRGHCFAVRGLYHWMQINPINPLTRHPLSEESVHAVMNVYEQYQSLVAGIFDAIRNRDMLSLARMLSHGLNSELTDENGRTLLSVAIQYGCNDVVRHLLATGPVWNYEHMDDAVIHDNLEAFLMLKEAGCSIPPEVYQYELLISTLIMAPLAVYERFVPHIDVRTTFTFFDMTGYTILHRIMMSWRYGRPDYVPRVRLALMHGADINATTSDGLTPLDFSTFSPEATSFMLEMGADPNDRTLSDVNGELARWEMIGITSEYPEGRDQARREVAKYMQVRDILLRALRRKRRRV